MMELWAAQIYNIPRPEMFVDVTPGTWELPCIVMQKIQGVSLATLLQGNQRLPLNRIKKILTQIIEFTLKATTLGIYHGDLKEDNIMIGSDDTVTILDLGRSQRGFPGKVIAREQFAGKNGYIPFELRWEVSSICKIPHRSTLEKVEVWAIGLLAYRMYAGYHLFPNGDLDCPRELTNMDYKLNYDFYDLQGWRQILQIPHEHAIFRNLVRRMLKPSSSERITIKTMAQHDFVKK